MATSHRVQALDSGASLLGVLKEYLSNPKLIEELQDEVVKLNTLTDEKAAELHDAQILVQQRDKLTKEIAEQRKTLADEKEKHVAETEKRTKDADDYVDAAETKIAEANAALDKREADLNEYASRLDLRENQLKEKAAVAKALFKE